MSSTNSPDDRSRDDERVAADGPPGEPSGNERQNGNAPAGEQREAGEDAETDRDDDAGEPRRAPGTLWAALRRILRFAWPYRRRLVGALALVSGGSLVALAVPLGLRELIDAVFEQGNTRLLNRLTIGLVMLFLAQAALSFFGQYLLKWTGERVVADLRQRLYAHLHRLSLDFFSRSRTGDLTSRLVGDVASVRKAATQALADLLTQSLSLLGSLALMLILNWRLSLVVLAVVPAVTGAAVYFGRKIRRLARRVQDRLADTTAIAEEALAGMRVVKGFARSGHETERYADAIEALFEQARRRVLLSVGFRTLVGLLFFGALVGVFWFGGREVLAGRLTAGDLVAFVFYAFNIARGVGQLSGLYTTFNSAAGASERIFELLDEEPEIADAPDARELPPVEGSVAFESVTFAYEPGTDVLSEITFDVEPGQTVALVGPSGAGKTTLMSLIPRFYDPQEGRVAVDGTDVRRVTLRSLRRQVALVSQEVQLFAASIGENIRYGDLDATDAEVEEAARTANAHGFITELDGGYNAEVGERGVRLSGGQRQRVAIARALLRKAPLLLLDEATSSLDAASERAVQRALDRLMAGRTTFVIAHRLSTVQGADRILVLDEGGLVETGTHTELMARPGGLYREMAAIQLGEAPADP
ncbi:MAG: ABC transporter ATP-binding protein [Bacteroidetes bacterium QS_8_68_28]|nr:MAG: ABC transporter ATP-binding protein [Bacteroidetes bacterium QS_8_68_28]